MFAISIKQPWADLLLNGKKRVEIRSWYSAYRGDLWLHSGRNVNEYALEYFTNHNMLTDYSLVRGAYIGVIRVNAIVQLDEELWKQWGNRHLDVGDYRPGQYAWLISPVMKFTEAVPSKGRVSLFTPDDETLPLLEKLYLS